MIVLTTISLALASAVCYRLGGLSKEQAKRDIPWCPQFLVNSKTRDVGCTLLTLFWLYLYCPLAWWSYLISGVLMCYALTTYWDEVFGEDNFYVHGLGIALALFPVMFNGLWLGFLLRCLLLSLLMGIWCKMFKNDYVEELGRGALIQLTLPILLV